MDCADRYGYCIFRKALLGLQHGESVSLILSSLEILCCRILRESMRLSTTLPLLSVYPMQKSELGSIYMGQYYYVIIYT